MRKIAEKMFDLPRHELSVWLLSLLESRQDGTTHETGVGSKRITHDRTSVRGGGRPALPIIDRQVRRRLQ
jgi:hypothetical protein